MKKLTLIISAFALVLGLSQCTKKPNVPTFDGYEKEITFVATGGDNSKGDFYETTDKDLRLLWEDGDNLLVYGSTQNPYDESVASYLGVMNMESHESENATFRGKFNIPDNVKALRFIHVGQGFGEINTANPFDMVYSTQNGVIAEGENNIGKKVVAYIDCQAASNNYGGTLKTRYAVIKFNLASMIGKSVTVKGYTNDKITLGTNGSLTYGKSAATVLNLGTITSSNSNYYLIVMPETAVTTYTFNDGTTDYTRKTNVAVAEGVFYHDGGVPTHADDGGLSGLFTVYKDETTTKKVRFSKGNLQYQATSNTWRFAEHQYDMIGEDNENIAENNSGWIDLFGWGTSGYNHNNGGCYQPWSTSKAGNYHAYNVYNYHFYSQTPETADWGYNAISNGGETSGMWRTLKEAEWQYVVKKRSTKCTGINNDSRWARASVQNGSEVVKGIILIPDDFTWPLGSDRRPYKFNTASDNQWNLNKTYSLEEMALLEGAGVVFLPAAGSRAPENSSSTSVVDFKVGEPTGFYWSSSFAESGKSRALFFSNTNFSVDPSANEKYYGFSVRLAKDAN